MEGRLSRGEVAAWAQGEWEVRTYGGLNPMPLRCVDKVMRSPRYGILADRVPSSSLDRLPHSGGRPFTSAHGVSFVRLRWSLL